MVRFYGNHEERMFCSVMIKFIKSKKNSSKMLDFFNVKKIQTISENVAKIGSDVV